MGVTVFTRRFCSYCSRAKRLLDELGLSYHELSVDNDSQALAKMKAESGRNTVPQIWIDGLHIGGCDDLFELHNSGQLRPLLTASSTIT